MALQGLLRDSAIVVGAFLAVLLIAAFFDPIVLTKLSFAPLPTEAMVNDIPYLWDTRHYAILMLEPQCSAFFPAWPRLVQTLFPATTMVEAAHSLFVVSWALALAGVPVLLVLFRAVLAESRMALWAVLLFTLSPLAIFRVIGYTEALFALEAALALWLILLVERGRANLPVLAGLFAAAFMMALTRQVFAQIVLSAIAALVVASVVHRLHALPNPEAAFRRRLAATVALAAGALAGFALYGFYCQSTGDTFLGSIQAQSNWNKRLQFNPLLLVLPRSMYLDLLGLYYPAITAGLAIVILWHTRGQRERVFVPQRSQPLGVELVTILYPPLWLAVRGIRQFAFGPARARRHPGPAVSVGGGKDYGVPLALGGYLFWFAISMAVAHSGLVLLTQDRLVSLARYVFGQPFFYVALAVIASGLSPKRRAWATGFALTVSAIELLVQWLRFGGNHWIG